MKKLSKRFKVISIISFLSIIIIFYLYIQNNWIDIEHFYIEREDIPKEFDGFKIAHISDVHLPKNASDIERIISLVKKQNPDIILMTGDIIDMSVKIQMSKLDELCKGLTKICDVYAVTGNHEVWNDNLDLWYKMLTENNVKVIDDAFEVIERNQGKLIISGLSDNNIYSSDIFDESIKSEDVLHLMLAHRPELFNDYGSNEGNIQPDLIFSGHAHGGQFRIPFVGGLIAPDQGYFPKYTSGIYRTENNDMIMIVSRGLGNSIIPFRINNRPHLPIVTLKSLH